MGIVEWISLAFAALFAGGSLWLYFTPATKKRPQDALETVAFRAQCLAARLCVLKALEDAGLPTVDLHVHASQGGDNKTISCRATHEDSGDVVATGDYYASGHMWVTMLLGDKQGRRYPRWYPAEPPWVIN